MKIFTSVLVVFLVAVVSAYGQVTLLQIEGDYASYFGAAVAAAGDVDLDGVPDFAVGAPMWETSGAYLGRAWVYSGKDGSPLLVFTGGQTRDWFGSSVAGGADLNADGFADVVVGAPDWNGFGPHSGLLQVFSGRTGNPLVAFEGDAASDRLGDQVAFAGDINLDGFADVLAVAPTDHSYIRAYSGRDLNVLYTRLADLGGSHVALVAGSYLDGDGYPDFATSSPEDDGAGREAGIARAYSGKDGATLFTWRGATAFEQLGYSLAFARDLDGDGSDEVLVGAPGTEGNGAALAFSGRTGAVLATVRGDARHPRTGLSVSRAGDVNGDHAPDILIGSQDSVRLFSGGDGALLFDLSGAAFSYFGSSLAALGDVNADGRADFVIGAPAGANSHGQVVVYAGTDCSPASATVYGSGWAGSHGVPAIASSAAPEFCSDVTITFENSRRFPTPAVLFAGTHAASLPTTWGGTLLVLPDVSVAIAVLLDGGLSVTASVPCDASLCGSAIHLQALMVDPGATHGVAFTPGLKLVLGN